MSHKFFDSDAERQATYRARLRKKACDAFWAAFDAGDHQGHPADFLALLTSSHKRGLHRPRFGYVGHKKCPLCQAEPIVVDQTKTLHSCVCNERLDGRYRSGRLKDELAKSCVGQSGEIAEFCHDCFKAHPEAHFLSDANTVTPNQLPVTVRVPVESWSILTPEEARRQGVTTHERESGYSAWCRRNVGTPDEPVGNTYTNAEGTEPTCRRCLAAKKKSATTVTPNQIPVQSQQ